MTAGALAAAVGCALWAPGLAHAQGAPTAPAARAASVRPSPSAPPLAGVGRLSCTVRSILGERRPGGIDPRLKMYPQLAGPPFAAFTRLQLLRTDPVLAPPGQPASLRLLNGRVLKLTYEGPVVAASKKPGAAGKRAYMLRLTIMRPKLARKLSDTVRAITDGETVFHGGQVFRKGTLILAVTCHRK